MKFGWLLPPRPPFSKAESPDSKNHRMVLFEFELRSEKGVTNCDTFSLHSARKEIIYSCEKCISFYFSSKLGQSMMGEPAAYFLFRFPTLPMLVYRELRLEEFAAVLEQLCPELEDA